MHQMVWDLDFKFGVGQRAVTAVGRQTDGGHRMKGHSMVGFSLVRIDLEFTYFSTCRASS